jgi:hypothetical protein
MMRETLAMNSFMMPGYLIVAIVIGLVAIPHRIGFLGGFLLSMILTPLGAALIMVAMQFFWPRARAADDGENN